MPLIAALRNRRLTHPVSGRARLASVVAVFLLLALSLGAIGWALYRHELADARADAGHAMGAIADLKASEVGHWLDERMGDARGTAQSPLLAREVTRLVADSRAHPSPDLIGSLRVTQVGHQYLGFALLDAAGTVRVSVGAAVEPRADDVVLVRDAIARCGTLVSPLRREPDRDGEPVRLDIVAGVPASDTTACQAALLLRIIASDSLFPLIQSWPTPSPSGEAVLVRREGDSVVFLNEVRHRSGTALFLRVPVTAPLVMADAVRGKRGTIVGADHRDVAVIAHAVPVPGTDWIVIAKIDEAEVGAPLTARARWMAAAFVMTLLAGAVAVGLIVSRRESRYYRDELAARSERDALLTHFAYLTRFANDIVLLLAPDGRIVECNERATQVYGWRRDELLTMGTADLRPLSDRDAAVEMLGRVNRDGFVMVEATHWTKDGHEFPVQISARLIETANGNYIQSIVLDITERRAALAQITRLNRLYAVRSAINHALARATDRDALLREVCRVWVEVGGHVRLAWVGFTDLDTHRVVPAAADGEAVTYLDEISVSALDVPEGRGPTGSAIRTGALRIIDDIAQAPSMAPWRPRAMAYGLRSSASVPLCVNGAWVGALTVYTGEPSFFDATERALLTGIGEDISAGLQHLADERLRRAAEERLRASEERFRTLFTATPFPLAVVDQESRRILAANTAMSRLYGIDPEALAGVGLDTVWPDLAAGRATLPFDGAIIGTRHVRRDETPIDVEMAATRITFDGRSVGFVSIQDVTDRHRLEMEVRQSQRMEAVGRLAGGVAHDFNNLLTVIRGYSAMLVDDMAVADPRRPAIEQIDRAADRAAGLTRQLLAFSRRQILQPRIVDLNHTVADTTTMLQRVIGEHIILRTDLAPDLGRVEVDPGQIDQVVMNLVINARDAMPDGGQITIATVNVTVPPGPTGVGPGDYVRLSVADTGPGIPPDVLPQIFEPFFTTKGVGEGTGLGLSTVQGIVAQSGGSVEVATETGRGTTFHVYLPRVPVAVATPHETAAGAADAEAPVAGTILVVEDEAAVRQLTQMVLERRGYTVLVASSAAEAMQVVSRAAGPIDLLLTDVVMPRTSGPQLAEALTATHPHLRVVYMSGYAENPLGTGSQLRSDVRLLAKPFTRRALEQIVHDALLDRPGGTARS